MKTLKARNNFNSSWIPDVDMIDFLEIFLKLL